jgi:hypothetical protein
MSRVAKDLRLARVESERAWPSTTEYAQNRELEWCRPTQDASMRPALVERKLGPPLFQTPTIGNDRDGPNPGRATSSLCPVWVFGRGRG